MNPKNRLLMVAAATLFAVAIGVSATPAAAQISAARENSDVMTKFAAPDPTLTSQTAAAYGNLPLSFEANAGQTDVSVKFLARGAGYTLFLTNSEAVLALSATRPRKQVYSAGYNAVVRMKLLGANPSPVVSGIDELPGKANYFIGNDPRKWRTDVANYAAFGIKTCIPASI